MLRPAKHALGDPVPARALLVPDTARGDVDMVRVVMISDTHGKHRDLDVPHGDILIHAGVCVCVCVCAAWEHAFAR
jgi:uncharacterized protein YijF (DUF1287 family)